MKIGEKGLSLIKSFEGCNLKAYKPVKEEKYWTIGWGHYGADVKQGQTITQAQADEMLKNDMASYEAPVNKYAGKYNFNQNEFDALVSFTYNCGAGSLNSLLANGTRSRAEIRTALLKYNKGANGKALAGLTRRRKAELELFNSGSKTSDGLPVLKVGSKGEAVKSLQNILARKNFSCHGDTFGEFGQHTLTSVRAFQQAKGLESDGIVGQKTWAKLQ